MNSEVSHANISLKSAALASFRFHKVV